MSAKSDTQEYMAIGTLAKMAGISVRTLQYYDSEGLLSPSALGAGGRRLYTYEDGVRLNQILSMKYLGFTLDAIKTRLTQLTSPADVVHVLGELADATREKIAKLTQSLEATLALQDEVRTMHSVDFKKYATIVLSLRMRNEMYGAIKHMDDAFLHDSYKRFAEGGGAQEIVDALGALVRRAAECKERGVAATSDEGMALAKDWWDLVQQFTGGDANLLEKLIELGSEKLSMGQELTEAMTFIQPALGAYFEKTGHNPFER